MTFHTFIKGSIIGFILFVLGDMLWHDMLLGSFYMERINAINGSNGAMGFPGLIILLDLIGAMGLTYFLQSGAKSLEQAAFDGALIGLLMSGSVNFVNHSLITKWDTTVTVVDTVWGIVLGLLVGMVIYATITVKKSVKKSTKKRR